MSKSRSRVLIAALAAVVLVGSGCDSTSSNGVVVLTFETDDFTFDFDSSSITAGEVERVATATRIDMEVFLNSQGFSKSDLQTAVVERVTLEVLFPVDENLAFLDDVTVVLSAAGARDTEIASRSGFPASDITQLEVDQTADVAFLLGRTDFTAEIAMVVNTIRQLEPYELELSIRIRLEVAEA